MATYGEMRIGEVRARRDSGIDIAEVEERTKIRTKYLRALENEDWEVLPGRLRKGFMRTYAHLLGLDAERSWTSSAAGTSQPRGPRPPRPGRAAARGRRRRRRLPGASGC